MKLTPKQIRKRREEFEAKIKKLQAEIEHVRVDWHHLQLECEHPNEHQTSCQGEIGTYCPDCGEAS